MYWRIKLTHSFEIFESNTQNDIKITSGLYTLQMEK